MEFDSFVLAAATADLDEEPMARGRADAVEFRMDLADADPVAAVDSYDGELPLLATNRAEWEGGDAGDAGRLDALVEVAAHGSVEAVDVELASLRTEAGAEAAAAARDHGTAVVASVHDFEATPDEAAMLDSLEAAAALGDVGKLAVTATDRGDALSVLSATHEATGRGLRVATMAMGEAGRHTRAVAPVYGSKIGYAPVDAARATAPGQYDLDALSDLVERLSSNPGF